MKLLAISSSTTSSAPLIFTFFGFLFSAALRYLENIRSLLCTRCSTPAFFAGIAASLLPAVFFPSNCSRLTTIIYGRHACMITDSMLTMRIPSNTGMLTTVPAESPFLSFHPSTQTHQIHLHCRLKTIASCWCLTCCYSTRKSECACAKLIKKFQNQAGNATAVQGTRSRLSRILKLTC